VPRRPLAGFFASSVATPSRVSRRACSSPARSATTSMRPAAAALLEGLRERGVYVAPRRLGTWRARWPNRGRLREQRQRGERNECV
jgi:hypothetical protein